ncbi:MAG: hypothetical protein HUK09_02350 [Bacteroidaceae bacterium]|nr:hypothetical protein [Bacteroidaceae bacterium]
MIIPIVIGLIIWLAVPLLLKGQLKKSSLKAATMVCKIIGLAIIIWTLIKQLTALVA